MGNREVIGSRLAEEKVDNFYIIGINALQSVENLNKNIETREKR